SAWMCGSFMALPPRVLVAAGRVLKQVRRPVVRGRRVSGEQAGAGGQASLPVQTIQLGPRLLVLAGPQVAAPGVRQQPGDAGSDARSAPDVQGALTGNPCDAALGLVLCAVLVVVRARHGLLRRTAVHPVGRVGDRHADGRLAPVVVNGADDGRARAGDVRAAHDALLSSSPGFTSSSPSPSFSISRASATCSFASGPAAFRMRARCVRNTVDSASSPQMERRYIAVCPPLSLSTYPRFWYPYSSPPDGLISAPATDATSALGRPTPAGPQSSQLNGTSATMLTPLMFDMTQPSVSRLTSEAATVAAHRYASGRFGNGPI